MDIAGKSPAVYDKNRFEKKQTVVLPSRRRLTGYKHYIRPQKHGFKHFQMVDGMLCY